MGYVMGFNVVIDYWDMEVYLYYDLWCGEGWEGCMEDGCFGLKFY